jgi:hypothetical protein
MRLLNTNLFYEKSGIDLNLGNIEPLKYFVEDIMDRNNYRLIIQDEKIYWNELVQELYLSDFVIRAYCSKSKNSSEKTIKISWRRFKKGHLKNVLKIEFLNDYS